MRLVGSGPGSCRCSGTSNPETETSWEAPLGTQACRETGHVVHVDGLGSSRGQGRAGSPEEGVVLYTDLPQPLGCSVVGKFEANGALKLFKLETS